MSRKLDRERTVILGLAARLLGRICEFREIRWPEDENRTTPDIDALVAERWAIEHTSLDTLPDQRRNEAWYKEVINPLEIQLRPTARFRLRVQLPYDSIATIKNRSQFRIALSRWIKSRSNVLPKGCSIIDASEEIPFRFRVDKDLTGTPGVIFSVARPHDDTLPRRLADLLDRKAAKLKSYQGPTATTLLLVENDSIALMAYGPFVEVYEKTYACQCPDGADEVWYVDTGIGSGPDYYRVA